MSDESAPPTPTPTESTPERQRPGGTTSADKAFTLIAIVWAIALVPILAVLMPSTEPSTHLAASTIDPNQAPWWELTALPRIGETTARKITAQRKPGTDPIDGQSPFRSPADLQRIRGIGPKTVRRLAPFLHFPAIVPEENDRTPQGPPPSQD